MKAQMFYINNGVQTQSPFKLEVKLKLLHASKLHNFYANNLDNFYYYYIIICLDI